MGKGIVWSAPARADLRVIDQQQALRILRTVARYVMLQEGDVIQLQGIDPPEFRLRAGDYRVRFYDRGASIYITSVKHRRDAYR